jgi:hypothetical protein
LAGIFVLNAFKNFLTMLWRGRKSVLEHRSKRKEVPGCSSFTDVFFIDAFHGQEDLADSVNHLLVVGFYLINVGYVAFALRTRAKENAAPPPFPPDILLTPKAG